MFPRSDSAYPTEEAIGQLFANEAYVGSSGWMDSEDGPFRVLTDALSATPPPKSGLVHYTPLDGAVGILGSNALWASDARHLNDASELTYITEPYDAAVAQIATEASIEGDITLIAASTWLQGLRHPDEGFLGHTGTTVFVASFCQDDDLLSQWRGYGNIGHSAYAITFDADLLEDLVTAPGPLSDDYGRQGVLRKVIYDLQEQVDLLYGYLHGTVKHLATMLEVLPEELRDAACAVTGDTIQGVMSYVSVVFKHPKFKEEQEWRLTLSEEGVPHDEKFRSSPLGLIPYRILRHPGLKQDYRGPYNRHLTAWRKYYARTLPVIQVRQGPATHPELAKRAMRRFMDMHGYFDYDDDLAAEHDMRGIKLRTTVIPYRR